MNAREWAMLLTLAAIWGGSFFFISVAVKALPPFTLVFLRVSIGAAGLLALLAVLRQTIPWRRATLVAFVGMGLLNNVIPQTLIVWAQGTLPGGYASILNATTPFFTVLILHVFTTGERATPARIAGVLIGFGGVATMIGVDILASAGHAIWPQLAMLAASFCYGLSNLWGRRIGALGIPPLAAAAGQLCASSLIILPLALALERPLSLPMPGAGVWAAVLGLALLCTAFAYILFFRIMATAGATNLSLVTFPIPVSAILLGILFLGEQLHPRHVVGMIVIGVGLACIDGRLLLRFGVLRPAKE